MPNIVLEPHPDELELIANDSPHTEALQQDLARFGWTVRRTYTYSDVPSVKLGSDEVIGFKSIALRFCCRT